MSEKGHPEHHRDISGGWFRAGSFGVSDGLVTNVSLILGFAGAHPSHEVVRLAGLSGLVAGSFSMALGELLSMRAQKELFEYEIKVEREALANDPEEEQAELKAIFVGRGIDEELSTRLAADLMRDPDLALRTHAREELGIDPSAVGSPTTAALSSLIAFAVGAFIPLLPWLLTSSGNQVWWSTGLAGAASLAIGGLIGWFTRRGFVRWALLQTTLTGIAAFITFGVGRLVGAG